MGSPNIDIRDAYQIWYGELGEGGGGGGTGGTKETGGTKGTGGTGGTGRTGGTGGTGGQKGTPFQEHKMNIKGQSLGGKRKGRERRGKEGKRHTITRSKGLSQHKMDIEGQSLSGLGITERFDHGPFFGEVVFSLLYFCPRVHPGCGTPCSSFFGNSPAVALGRFLGGCEGRAWSVRRKEDKRMEKNKEGKERREW
jgi:hypothetical protein